VLDPHHAIYAAKNVAAIPLTLEGAQKLLTGIRARNTATARISLIATPSSESQNMYQDVSQTVTPTSATEPRVKFVDVPEVKIMTPGAPDQHFVVPDIPEADQPTSPASVNSALSSGASTPTSEKSNTTQLAKILSERLSFWNRLPARRTNMVTSPLEVLNEAEQLETPAVDVAEQVAETDMHSESVEKDELSDALAAPASAPVSEEDKHRELEEKILRQTVKDFAKGEMYFAYDFGKSRLVCAPRTGAAYMLAPDITRSLQHKQDLICKSKRQSRLIEELTSSGGENPHSATVGDEVDVLSEPLPTLPLWRRVDRQFWWNENLLRPFIDAGVCTFFSSFTLILKLPQLHDYVLPVIQGYFQISSFPVPREPELNESGDAAIVDYIIMSRRSRDRAGLRYQRRGVDDDAHVANFVETETITRIEVSFHRLNCGHRLTRFNSVKVSPMSSVTCRFAARSQFSGRSRATASSLRLSFRLRRRARRISPLSNGTLTAPSPHMASPLSLTWRSSTGERGRLQTLTVSTLRRPSCRTSSK
jgi:hypothetical protein